MNWMRGIAIAAGILLALSVVPGAMAQVTNQYQNDNVAHEPENADTGSSLPSNGFGSASPGSWDLVLNHRVENDALNLAEFNAIYREALEVSSDDGANAERFIFPGAADSDLYWGWFNDKGSDGYMREAGQGSGSPDGVIDDGDDDGTDDVQFGDAAQAAEECGRRGPTCWQATGSWDEFVWRGPNEHVATGNLTHIPNANNDPSIESFADDVAHAFVQPGTHSSYFKSVRCETCANYPYPPPGYGIISEGNDAARAPDFQYNWLGQSWSGPLFIPDDTSLLITTEVTAAANTSKTTGQLRDPGSADAVDVDVYSSIGAGETLYRTAVWDPGDQQDSPLDAVYEEGPKDEIKSIYSNDVPETWQQISETVNELLQPTEPAQGAADDATGMYAPYKHEPAHPADGQGFGAADYNQGADYNGQLSEGDYYANPTQDWSGYANSENLWVDVENRYNLYALVLQGAFGNKFGYNTASPTTQDDQQTQGPGILSHFTRVGTWYDTNGDTWIGNINETGRCSSYEDPYCEGTSDQPQDYSSNPQARDGNNYEFRGTCDAEVKVTFTPLGTPTNGDGEPAWGTTTPPTGVYRYPVFNEAAFIDGADTPQRIQERYVQYGAQEYVVPCDDDSEASGQYFPSEGLLFPTGSIDYPIKMEVTGELTTDIKDRTDSTRNLKSQTVTDTDIINHWQDETTNGEEDEGAPGD
jgi:hypothetical protein